MSLNIHLTASYAPQRKHAKKRVDECKFIWQTPNNVTHRIMAARSKLLTYLDWAAMECRDSGDFLEHQRAIRDWLDDHREWDIKWEAW